MRNSFKLTLLSAALLLAGCGTNTKPAELEVVEPQSQYDAKIQDALGVQKYTEAQMLYQRRFNDYQKQLDELEEKRKNLDAALNARAYENGLAEAPESSSEGGRIREFQAASQASQARIAEEVSKHALRQSLLENTRDKELLEAESRAAQQIADIEIQSAKDLAAAEDRINQDIQGRKSSDAAARLEESKKFDEQRFTLALANAEAERQAKSKLQEESDSLTRLRTDADSQVALQEARIAELRRQIAELEDQILKSRAGAQQAIALQESKVSVAQAEVDRLAKISQQLKSSTAPILASSSGQDSGYVQAKESELSRVRAEFEIKKTQQIAAINAKLAQEKNDITSKARSGIAALTASTEMAKASVVAPVVTGRAVYAGDAAIPPAAARSTQMPKAAVSPSSKPAVVQAIKPAPVLTINRFEPKVSTSPNAIRNEDIGGTVLAGGGVVGNASPQASPTPLVVAPKSRSVFDVYYVYKDEASWNKFQEYLKAYGITDFEPSRSNKTGEFFIYCGRYYDEDQASSRVTFLNKTTSTNHVQVRRTEVPR